MATPSSDNLSDIVMSEQHTSTEPSTLHGPTPAALARTVISEPLFAREIILVIAKHLDVPSKATFALCCRKTYHILGKDAVAGLGDNMKRRIVMQLSDALPGRWFCEYCIKWHRFKKRLESSYRRALCLRPRVSKRTRPKATYNASIRLAPEITTNIIPLISAIRRSKLGDDFGEPLAWPQLKMFHAQTFDWTSFVDTKIHHGRLFVRVEGYGWFKRGDGDTPNTSLDAIIERNYVVKLKCHKGLNIFASGEQSRAAATYLGLTQPAIGSDDNSMHQLAAVVCPVCSSAYCTTSRLSKDGHIEVSVERWTTIGSCTSTNSPQWMRLANMRWVPSWPYGNARSASPRAAGIWKQFKKPADSFHAALLESALHEVGSVKTLVRKVPDSELDDFEYELEDASSEISAASSQEIALVGSS